MKLERIDVRFYKSFNYDYERRFKKDALAESWENTTDGWYPFLRIKVDPQITAVVGANESGKSQLLGATEAALTGAGIDQADFCRYSVFYSVQAGEMRAPEFGAVFLMEDDTDVELVAAAGVTLAIGETFALYRPGFESPFLLLRKNPTPLALTTDQLEALQSALPTVYKMETDLGMPDTMSISELSGKTTPTSRRRQRAQLISTLEGGTWADGPNLGAGVFPIWQSLFTRGDAAEEEKRRKEFELGRKLLIDIARIDPKAFTQLQHAIDNEREGEIEGLIGAMNKAIAENLNFQRWWTQDKHFDLQVKARERELALVIRDRTNASYSFDERSQGLRYFLSYFVQLTAHRLSAKRGEVMLLDEPDAFLSSVGQQDLLRVLEDYASPEVDAPSNQVIYVTHSPFLIDRNAGHRIRVLDKGAEDEGTRIVKDVAQNHYEPLRTSLGSFAAETALIGGMNLFVEGIADQVLLAGISNHLSRTDSDVSALDLNRVTIVPCGAASSVPYMIYLARGRGSDKPPSVALLDGDAAGKEAARQLRRGLVTKHRVLLDAYVVELDVWASRHKLKLSDGVTVHEIEDLLPIQLAADAARANAKHIEGFGDDVTKKLTADAISSDLDKTSGSLWDAVESAYASAFEGCHIEKIGFAREVVNELGLGRRAKAPKAHAEATHNFALLLSHLSELLTSAAADETAQRSGARIDRVIRGFEKDHPHGITKSRALSMLREIETVLDDSDLANSVRMDLNALRRDFDLEREVGKSVADFPAFRDRMSQIHLIERYAAQDENNAESQERAVE